MRQIRRGVFETNSSSTHSLTMCMKEDYDKWAKGEVYLNEGGWSSYSEYKDKQFVTKKEAIDIITHSRFYTSDADLNTMDKDKLEECFRENDIYSIENYDNEYLEGFKSVFTTPNGDVVVAFGQYGYDG